MAHHQRYPSEVTKEPHSISLKVLRLSRPSLVPQHAYSSPHPSDLTTTSPTHPAHPTSISKSNPASLSYASTAAEPTHPNNPDPFVLSPILNLPPSFGTAYVGETFACALCANHEVMAAVGAVTEGGASGNVGKRKKVTDVRVEAEMKTPTGGAAAGGQGDGGGVVRLKLYGRDGEVVGDTASGSTAATGVSSEGGGSGRKRATSSVSVVGGGEKGSDLEPGHTLQRNLVFELKEEGNHVLAVTVSYYEKTETSGRTRTFRKLYQFMCRGSVVVRTKCTALASSPPSEDTESAMEKAAEGRGGEERDDGEGRLRWVLEAQLENCTEEVMQLDRVVLDLAPGLKSRSCNFGEGEKPVLHPGEVEQVMFVVEEEEGEGSAALLPDGRAVFGVLGIGWRNEMGNRGFLNTGKLVAKVR